MKKARILLIAIVLAIVSVAAVGCKDGAKQAKVTDGIFEDSLSFGGATYSSTIKFKENGEYFTGYLVAAGQGTFDAGEWEVIEKSKDYTDPGPDYDVTKTEDNVACTASKVVKLTSFVTGESVEYAYDRNTIWEVDCGSGAKNRKFEHKADKEYDETEEVGVIVKKFYFENKEGSSITLYHDKSFSDYTGETAVDGTWTKVSATVFTLNGEDGEVFTLTVSADGKTATLKVSDTETLDLSSSLFSEAYKFEGTASDVAGKIQGAYDVDATAEVELVCYDNDTFELSIVVTKGAMFTSESLIVAAGTYSVDNNVFSFTFEGNDAPIKTTTVDGFAKLNYTFSGSYNDGGVSVTAFTVELSCEVVAISHTFESTTSTIPYSGTAKVLCYNDGTFVVKVNVAGNESEIDSGTYTTAANAKFGSYGILDFTFTFTKGKVSDVSTATTTAALNGATIDVTFASYAVTVDMLGAITASFKLA